MKKVYLFILMLACFHFAKGVNEIPNAGFENWTSGNPDNWTTNNYAGYWVPITATTQEHSGTYAAMGQTATYSIYKYPPQLNTGATGFTISQNYNNFEFYYKTNLAGGDKFIVAVVIFNASHGGIAAGVDTIVASTSVFNKLDVGINYPGGGTGAFATISFSLVPASGSGSNTDPSSYFVVDDLSLNTLTALQQSTPDNGLHVFPVPAHDRLTVNGLTGNKPIQFILIDAAGRVVMDRKSEISSNNLVDAELNLQGIAPGFYSLRLMTDDKLMMQRIVIQ